MLAPASPAQAINAGKLTLGGVDVDLLNVPGHASQMYAVRFGELLYAADALFGPEALTKHPLTFCVDSAAMKRSAASLLELAGVNLIVPGHGEPTKNLTELVSVNLAAFQRVTDAVLTAVQTPTSVDEALRRFCQMLDIEMTNPGAVVLNRSAVSSHLAELAALGRVALTVKGNQLLFGTI